MLLKVLKFNSSKLKFYLFLVLTVTSTEYINLIRLDKISNIKTTFYSFQNFLQNLQTRVRIFCAKQDVNIVNNTWANSDTDLRWITFYCRLN